MQNRSKATLMWGLYAVLLLAVLLVQTVILGQVRVWGGKPNLMPMAVICVAVWTGHERGGLFALVTAVLWALTGADDGALSIVSFTLCAIAAGWLCDSVLPRRLVPCVLLCLVGLLFHGGADFLLKFYLGEADWSLALWVPATVACSIAASPVLYLLCKAIGKVGES